MIKLKDSCPMKYAKTRTSHNLYFSKLKLKDIFHIIRVHSV